MKRWLYAHRTVVGDLHRLEDLLTRRLGDLLVRATGETGAPKDVDGSFLVRLDSTVGGIPATKEVRALTGVASRRERRLRVPLSWYAATARPLYPVFDGVVEFEPLGSNAAQLTLTGPYTVPLGPVGAAFDAAGMRHVAERTAEELVQRLADQLMAAAQGGVPEQGTAEGPGEAAGTMGPLPATGIDQVHRLTVRDVMTPDPLVLDEQLPVRTAALLLFHYGVAGAPVVSEIGELVGVLSEADLLEKEAFPATGLGRAAIRSDRRREAVTVGEACSRPARVTHPDAGLHAAARVMLDHKVARLVVVDAGRLVGIMSRHDLLRALIRSDAEIQAGVDAVLRALAEPSVTATVEWGVVRLEGSARYRSRVPYIVRSLSEVDGVVTVAGDLEWDDDDVAPTSYGMPRLQHQKGPP
jgi:CBS domain-containing protein